MLCVSMDEYTPRCGGVGGPRREQKQCVYVTARRASPGRAHCGHTSVTDRADPFGRGRCRARDCG